MLTELDQKVLELQAARVELNILIEDLVVVKKALNKLLKKLWNSDRLAEYRKNEGIINYAEFDASFQKYWNLNEKHKNFGDAGMTEQDLEEYRNLLEHFSAYRAALQNKDVILVGEHYASELATIDQCSKEMMQSVAKFEACRTEAVEIVGKTRKLTEQDIKEFERALNLYALIDRKTLPISEFEPELLLSERLEVVTKMIEEEVVIDCTPMNLLKVDCMRIMHARFLWKYAGLEGSELTRERVEVYQFQNTDITDPQTITTLDDVVSLIENAAANYTIVRNLAAICKGEIDAATIESETNQKILEMLKDTFDARQGDVVRIYGFKIDEYGNIASSDEKIIEIEERFVKIQQDEQAISLPYTIGKTDSLYRENTAIVVDWLMKVDKDLNGALFEARVV